MQIYIFFGDTKENHSRSIEVISVGICQKRVTVLLINCVNVLAT